MRRIFSQSGQTLIQVLVSIAIMGIMAATMTSMFQQQQHEARALAEKLAALDFQRSVTSSLMAAQSCMKTVAATNVNSGSFTFSPSSITSTNADSPTIIAGLRQVIDAGNGVLATSTTRQPVSPLVGSLAVKTGDGIQVGGYLNNGSIQYVLRIRFDQPSLVRSIKDLILPVVLTTQSVGAQLRVVGCLGAGGGPGSGSVCGMRTAFCAFPNGVTYGPLRDPMGSITWNTADIPCEGNTLTAQCNWDGGPGGNTSIRSVVGCPSGYSGRSTSIGNANPDPNAGFHEIAQIFCAKI